MIKQIKGYRYVCPGCSQDIEAENETVTPANSIQFEFQTRGLDRVSITTCIPCAPSVVQTILHSYSGNPLTQAEAIENAALTIWNGTEEHSEVTDFKDIPELFQMPYKRLANKVLSSYFG